MQVCVNEVFVQYGDFCKRMQMRPCGLAEFGDTLVMLGQQGLLAVLAGGGRGGARGGGAGVNAGMAGRLRLLVQPKDVQAALKSNPVFRNLIGQ